MKRRKNYRYKVWVEVERVEIDAHGNEIGEHEGGELFGVDPEKIANLDTLESTLALQVILLTHGETVIGQQQKHFL